ncbi:MAG: hypothetical protein V5804_10485 [Mucilaginibacter sp.]|uniref:hypothetical protein n=1 Tax=Mucilaginibacter sp. TaxID=1882438 RepID=UPI0034E5A854
MKQLFTLVIIFFSLNCIGQTYSKNDFYPYPISKVPAKEWEKLDIAKTKSFSVFINAGKLKIVKDKPLPAGIEYAFANGKLLAFDCGEWGGGLYYKPFDASNGSFVVNGQNKKATNEIGSYDFILPAKDPTRNLIKDKYVRVASGNTKAIIPYKDYCLFIQGLAHMSENYGSLSKLTVQKDSFTVSKVLDLDAAPTTMTVYKDKIFILTYNSFYCINKQKKELILNNLFWRGLYPHSIAVINERNIYIGIYGGYAKINLPKKELKLFMYNKQ